MLTYPDVFSFSVSLFEALYGVRPYRGRSYGDYYAALALGPPSSPPKSSPAPTWLFKAIRRGMAVKLRPDYLMACLNLSTAYQSAGRPLDSMEMARRAAALARAQGETELAKRLEEQLRAAEWVGYLGGAVRSLPGLP